MTVPSVSDRVDNMDAAPRGPGGAAPAAADPSAPRQALLRHGRTVLGVVCGVVFGVAIATAWLADGGQAASARDARPPTAELSRADERLAALEDTTRRLEAALARAVPASGRGGDVDALRGAQQERFILAMLHLQAALTSARPWLREYEVAVGFAPPDALPRPVAEILASHAARGVVAEADLRERFAALAPILLTRAPRQGGMMDQAAAIMRAALAAIGLAAPPPPSDADTTVSRIQDQLRRGNLAAAVSDAATLDASLQPLIAGWMAQARAARGRAGGAGDIAAGARPRRQWTLRKFGEQGLATGGRGVRAMTQRVQPARKEASVLRIAMKAAVLMAAVATSLPAAAQGSITQRDRMQIVSSASSVAVTEALVSRFTDHFEGVRRPQVRITGTGRGFEAFCVGIGPETPDILVATRRMPRSTVENCQANGVAEIIEIRLGLGAVVLAARRGDPATPLTSNQVYEALAAEHAQNETFVTNRTVAWADVDPALPRR